VNAEEVVRSYLAALEAKDLARFDLLVSPDLVFVTPPRPLGKKDLLAVFRAIWDGFPTGGLTTANLSAPIML
jgi:ketosteroid isomerase-like protein